MTMNPDETYDAGLINPAWVATPVAGQTSDQTFLDLMDEVEVAWVEVLAENQLCSMADLDAVRAACVSGSLNLRQIADSSPGGGNPLIPLLGAIRANLEHPVSALHRGATSQDIIDTAMVLMAQRVGATLLGEAKEAVAAGIELAQNHRKTPMVARSLTQHSLPSTFGYRAASWMAGIGQAAQNLEAVLAKLPLQWGGAAGTMASLVQSLESTGQSAFELHDRLAEKLGLLAPEAPWHTNRQIIAQLGSAVAELILACGKVANDVLLSARPEVAELREPTAPGRGGSSAMPHKQNPVLSVLIKSAALSAPGALSQLMTGIAAADEERPSGGWHVEWPSLRELLRLAGGATEKTRELLAGLVVREDNMARNMNIAGPILVSERIMTVLAPAIDAVRAENTPTGREQIQGVVDNYLHHDDVDLVAELEKISPEEFDRARLEELTAVENYVGTAPELTDRLCDKYREWSNA